MNDRLELAKILYDWTINSKTTFIEDDSNLSETIKKLGIPYPNPDLAFFTTVYCELDVYNRNNAMLPKAVAEKGLDTIKFKQINFEHEGASHLCGFILDARIIDNFIVIDGVIFKSVWKEQFAEVKKYFERGNLNVSFELWNNEDGKSILKVLPDGKKIVEKLLAHGCGLLMKEKPACPKAKVFKLMASEELVIASAKIDESISKQDERLVYAELSIKEECKNCGNCPNERGKTSMAEEIMVNEFEDTEIVELAEDFQLTDEDIQLLETEEESEEEGDTEEAKKLSYKSRQNLKDSDFAVVIKKGDKKIRKYPIYDAAHVRNALARLGQAKAKEGLKKLGVSVESVLKKVKARAKKFGIETAMETVELPQGEKCEICGQFLGEGQEGKRCPNCIGVGQPTDATKASEEIKKEEVKLPEPRPCKNCGQNLGEGQEGDFCPACVVFEQEFSKIAEVLEEAAIPAEVLKRIKELHKEGKSMKEAMKQAWKEQKEKAAEVEKAHLDTMKHCSGCGMQLAEGSEGELCAMCNLKHEKAHLQESCDQLMKESEAHKVSYADLQKKYEDMTKEYGDKCKALEDKIVALTQEQENAKQELGKKDQEITDLKIVKAKAETKEGKPSLTVGSVDSVDDDKYKELRDKVDQKAFGAKSLGAK